MANAAKPYKEGSGWSHRRYVFGKREYVSGHASSAAAKKAMDKRVAALEAMGKPKGLGPCRTTVAQAMQDLGMERLPFMKGARQEANRLNRYLRLAGLATLKVTPWEPAPAAQGGLPQDKPAKKKYFVVTLQAPNPKRAIPRGLGKHRDALAGQIAAAEHLRAGLARMRFCDVQPYHVQAFLDAIRAASREPATLQLERAILRGLFNHARNVWCWSEPHSGRRSEAAAGQQRSRPRAVGRRGAASGRGN
jgi:hypothetical protein